MDLQIERGRVLVGDSFVSASVHMSPSDAVIHAIDSAPAATTRLNAEGLLVLPGIVDIHGDSLERQMLPRPTAEFPIDIALKECDHQAVCQRHHHAVPRRDMVVGAGPARRRSRARAVLDHMERLRPTLAADTRYHLRHEVYNLDDEDEIIGWLSSGRVALLAFNDHLSLNLVSGRERKLGEMVARSGLSKEQFLQHAERVKAKANELPASIARLAAAAVAHSIPIASHDETSPEQRRWFHDIGCRVAEFPTNVETAAVAAAHGDHIVFGAPNVVRGGSHTGWVGAADMVERGLCSVLASDYYYPSQLLAAFRLASDGIASLPAAWRLVSENAAIAVGLQDRGRIAVGCRADLVLVDDQSHTRPKVIATIVGGRVVYLNEVRRLG